MRASWLAALHIARIVARGILALAKLIDPEGEPHRPIRRRQRPGDRESR